MAGLQLLWGQRGAAVPALVLDAHTPTHLKQLRCQHSSYGTGVVQGGTIVELEHLPECTQRAQGAPSDKHQHDLKKPHDGACRADTKGQS